MKNKKALDLEIARVIEKINSDPKKAAQLVTDWLGRPSKNSQIKSTSDKPSHNKTTVRKKAA